MRVVVLCQQRAKLFGGLGLFIWLGGCMAKPAPAPLEEPVGIAVHDGTSEAVTLSLEGGAALAGRQWAPPDPWGVVLAVHGSVSHAGWFEALAEHLNRAGLAVVAYDRPGWGRTPGPRGRMDDYVSAIHQVREAAAEARSRYGRVHLVGLSWGGVLALRAAMEGEGLFDSVTLVAPGLADARPIGWRDGLRVVFAKLRHSTGFRWRLPYAPEDFSKSPEWRRYVAADPLRVREVCPNFIFGTRRMRGQLRSFCAHQGMPPIQCLLAGDDTITDNRRVRKMANRAGISVIEYEGMAHSLIFEAPDRVADDIVRLAGGADNQPDRGGANAR